MRLVSTVVLAAALLLACGPAVPVNDPPAAVQPGGQAVAALPTPHLLDWALNDTTPEAGVEDQAAPVTGQGGQRTVAESHEVGAVGGLASTPAVPTVEPAESVLSIVEPTVEPTAEPPESVRPTADDDATLAPAPTATAAATLVEQAMVQIQEEPCEPRIPVSLPARGDPRAQDFWQAFREPLAPAELWNPPGPRRVGLQVGHWKVEEAPPELERLDHGASAAGKAEWEVNLDIAERTRALLEQAGVQVDLLPATVPVRYRAHAFVSIHADGDTSGQLRGFKIARPGFSSVPAADDRLVAALNAAYEPATGLPRDDEHISRRMLYYYAFNSRRYCHAVAPGVPQVIVETGFLTSAADRDVLLDDPDAAARGIAAGILTFLDQQPADAS